jgi:pyruvate/2-oxoglutarate dehydrogenase complex dihydrolipoamide acyltransferase (E2) component
MLLRLSKSPLAKGRLEEQDHLSITLSFDHGMVDGAPAARFARPFANLLETGYGLETALASREG